MDHNDYPNRFAIGLPIDLHRMEVALLKKKRGPYFNVGKFNGCGGHIKIGESPVGCIRREAEEEFGLVLPASGQWQQFHYERRVGSLGEGNLLYFYCAAVSGLRDRVRTTTDELVYIISIPTFLRQMSDLADPNSITFLGDDDSEYVYNMGYLIPMAFSWLKNPAHAYVEG